jgi:hypothetical protein
VALEQDQTLLPEPPVPAKNLSEASDQTGNPIREKSPMNQRLIWTTRGLTHRATVTGNDLDGYEVRSDCGILGPVAGEDLTPDELEITCSRCRKAGEPKPPSNPSPGTERNGQPIRPRNRNEAEGPKSLQEILDEMGYGPASERDEQRDSC